MITQIINGIEYAWTPADTLPSTLYGQSLRPASLIPDGMVMTLVTFSDQTLTLRGELLDDTIVFFHVTDGRELGAWVKTREQKALETLAAESHAALSAVEKAVARFRASVTIARAVTGGES